MYTIPLSVTTTQAKQTQCYYVHVCVVLELIVLILSCMLKKEYIMFVRTGPSLTALTLHRSLPAAYCKL